MVNLNLNIDDYDTLRTTVAMAILKSMVKGDEPAKVGRLMSLGNAIGISDEMMQEVQREVEALD